jgi:hypothetical protein
MRPETIGLEEEKKLEAEAKKVLWLEEYRKCVRPGHGGHGLGGH